MERRPGLSPASRQPPVSLRPFGDQSRAQKEFTGLLGGSSACGAVLDTSTAPAEQSGELFLGGSSACGAVLDTGLAVSIMKGRPWREVKAMYCPSGDKHC